jgi:hypothetical protein
MLGKIPSIPKELDSPIRSLANAAYLFRGVFVQAAEGKSIEDIVNEREEVLLLAEKVVDTWCAHLGIDSECSDGSLN